MSINEESTKSIEKIRLGAFKTGLFSQIARIDDKETMKWILIKFLKESLEFLSNDAENRKIQRGTLVEHWIDVNLNLGGNYDRPLK